MKRNVIGACLACHGQVSFDPRKLHSFRDESSGCHYLLCDDCGEFCEELKCFMKSPIQLDAVKSASDEWSRFLGLCDCDKSENEHEESCSYLLNDLTGDGLVPNSSPEDAFSKYTV